MTTPICDLIEQLLSRGTSPGDAIAIARPMEEAITSPSGSTAEQRERWRLKKKRQRSREGGQSTGDVPLPYSIEPSVNTGLKSKKERTQRNVPGDVPPVDDGWPSDFAEQFWIAFPPYRRQAKMRVAVKLTRIRSEGKVSWEALFGGVKKFAATNPGEFAPAPMVWLNDGRWDRVYGGGSNGKNQGAGGGIANAGFAGLAARARFGFSEEAERPDPADLEPVNRR